MKIDMTDIEKPHGDGFLSGGASSATVISYTHKSDGEDGLRPFGVGLCWKQGGYEEFVTWNIYYDDERGEWFAESGHYFRSIIEAAEDYKRRGGV